MLSRLGWNVGLDVFYVFFNAFSNDFFSDDCVEEYIELDDNFLQVVLLIGVLFSHEKPIFLFKDVLDLTDDMGSPYDLPVFLGV